MTPPPPDARLFIAPGCPHCPVVLHTLTELVESGAVGRLEVINVAHHAELAASAGVRSAPWTQLGPFLLEGVLTPAEIRRWAALAHTPAGDTAYIESLLANGRLQGASDYIVQQPGKRLAAMLPLVCDPERPIQVKLGAGALFEDYTDTPELRSLTAELCHWSEAADPRVRTDVCHLLGLTGELAAIPSLQARLDDEDGEVREVATEALARLTGMAD